MIINKVEGSILLLCILISFFCILTISSGSMIISTLGTLAQSRIQAHHRQLALQALIDYSIDLAQDALSFKPIQEVSYLFSDWFKKDGGSSNGFLAKIYLKKSNNNLEIRISLADESKNSENKTILAFIDDNEVKVHSIQ